MIIDKLLTIYTDKVNDGEKVNINEFILQAKEEDRQELKELCEMIDIFKSNTNENFFKDLKVNNKRSNE